MVPYAVLNTGMLPNQLCAFTEGLFGAFNSEFERTPKAASVTDTNGERPSATSTSTSTSNGRAQRRDKVKVHRPYVVAEAAYLALQVGWCVHFLRQPLIGAALGAAFVACCVGFLCFHYGDDEGRRLFVFRVRHG